LLIAISKAFSTIFYVTRVKVISTLNNDLKLIKKNERIMTPPSYSSFLFISV